MSWHSMISGSYSEICKLSTRKEQTASRLLILPQGVTLIFSLFQLCHNTAVDCAELHEKPRTTPVSSRIVIARESNVVKLSASKNSPRELLSQLLPEPPRRHRHVQILCKTKCDAACDVSGKFNDDADNDGDEDVISRPFAFQPKLLPCEQNCMKKFSGAESEEQCLDWIKKCNERADLCWGVGSLSVRSATIHSLEIEWQPPVSMTSNISVPVKYVALIAYGSGGPDSRLLLSSKTMRAVAIDEPASAAKLELYHRWTVVEVDHPNRSKLELTKICTTNEVNVKLLALSPEGIVAVSKSYTFDPMFNKKPAVAFDEEEPDNDTVDMITSLRNTSLVLRQQHEVATALEWNLPLNWSSTDLQYYQVDFQTEFCSTNFAPDFIPESRRPTNGRIQLTLRLGCRYVFEVEAVSVCNRVGATARIKIDASCAHISNSRISSSLCKSSHSSNMPLSLFTFSSLNGAVDLTRPSFIGQPPLSMTHNATWTVAEYDAESKTARIKLWWPQVFATSSAFGPKIGNSANIVHYKTFWGPVEALFKPLPTIYQLIDIAAQTQILVPTFQNLTTSNSTMSFSFELKNFTLPNTFGFKIIAFIRQNASNMDKPVDHAAALSAPAVISATDFIANNTQYENVLYGGWRIASITVLACITGVILACCCCQWRGPRWCRKTLGLSNLLLNRQSSTNTYINTGNGGGSTRAWMMTPLTTAASSTASHLHRLGRPLSSNTMASNTATAYKSTAFEQAWNKPQRPFVRSNHSRSHLIARLSQASAHDSINSRPMSVTLANLPTPPPVPNSIAALNQHNPFEIPRCQLELGECLGRGAFGQVVKAKYFMPSSTTRDEYDEFFSGGCGGGDDSGVFSGTSLVAASINKNISSCSDYYYEMGDNSVKRATGLLRQQPRLALPLPRIQQTKVDQGENCDEQPAVVQAPIGTGQSATAHDHSTLMSRTNSKCDVRRVKSGDSSVTILSTAANSSTTSSSFMLTVAIKSLRTDNIGHTEQERLRFDREIDLMASIGQHPHVVTFIGYCFLSNSDPMSHTVKGLVLEYCELGDLANYLRKARERQQEGKDGSLDEKLQSQAAQNTDDEVSLVHQLSWARQIAIGMEWLSAQEIVHRDVAARNVLLKSKQTVKITDFGLARRLSDSTHSLIYDCALVHRNRLPVKWLAIESLEKMIFSSASDVWAYGIALYEIVTLGSIPYDKVANADLLSLLKSGRRAEKPTSCSLEIYHVMLLCWSEHPESRPTFPELVYQLERLMQDLLLKENHYVDLPSLQN